MNVYRKASIIFVGILLAVIVIGWLSYATDGLFLIGLLSLVAAVGLYFGIVAVLKGY